LNSGDGCKYIDINAFLYDMEIDKICDNLEEDKESKDKEYFIFENDL
jgi:hypothetical protein